MNFLKTELEGVWIIEPKLHSDSRGYFCETYRADLFEQATGIRPDFVQDNESESSRGVVRGLHFQAGSHSQAKLVRVSYGAIIDCAVDLRRSSPTFGRHILVELSRQNRRQLFIPRGFAHGFAVLTPKANFIYKTDNFYNPQSERTILFDDPDLAIQWPLD
ncbi:MAG: dTDP-4-dehydrorhamnose 3,5-epimerase, partial [Muribaculaceae bacterium]|nr:dTDP-4-dehydrorhamnose 3,5-epimerase [Muribaculaceae bacterium]